jgi:hypothetical protein
VQIEFEFGHRRRRFPLNDLDRRRI